MLSKRLSKIAYFVTYGNRLVDVGCDHAILPIELVKSKVCPSAIVIDINEGPINIAKINIKKAGLENKIVAIVSDGLSKIKMFEGDTLVISGMGGNTIINILKKYDIVAKSFKEIIIEPQSKITLLRYYLYYNEFYLLDEDMVRESGNYYPILKVLTKKGLTDLGISSNRLYSNSYNIYNVNDLKYYHFIFGPYLIKNKNRILYEFLHNEMERMRKILTHFFLINNKINDNSLKKIKEYIDNISLALADFNL